ADRLAFERVARRRPAFERAELEAEVERLPIRRSRDDPFALARGDRRVGARGEGESRERENDGARDGREEEAGRSLHVDRRGEGTKKRKETHGPATPALGSCGAHPTQRASERHPRNGSRRPGAWKMVAERTIF